MHIIWGERTIAAPLFDPQYHCAISRRPDSDEYSAHTTFAMTAGPSKRVDKARHTISNLDLHGGVPLCDVLDAAHDF